MHRYVSFANLSCFLYLRRWWKNADTFIPNILQLTCKMTVPSHHILMFCHVPLALSPMYSNVHYPLASLTNVQSLPWRITGPKMSVVYSTLDKAQMSVTLGQEHKGIDKDLCCLFKFRHQNHKVSFSKIMRMGCF